LELRENKEVFSRSLMSKAKLAAKRANRRGSPEAIEKRRAARFFNDVLGGRRGDAKRDGRTEKRRQRLLRELEDGVARGSRELKPLDVLQRVQELMDLGEPIGAIRKIAKVRKSNVLPDSIVEVVGRLHNAYHFRPETYRFVGIGEDVLRSAGVFEPSVAKPGVTVPKRLNRSPGRGSDKVAS
jgi:hypothetical protein